MTVSIQTIKNYAKACGVKNILQTKPVKLSNVNFEGLKQLHSDTFIYKNPYYFKMTAEEKALIPKVLHNTKMGKAFVSVIPELHSKNYEQAFVFGKNGELIAKSNTKKKFSFDFSAEDSRKLNVLGNIGVKMGMIHNHPNEFTFSKIDLEDFYYSKCTTMMAKTPKGYAYIQRDKNLGERFITTLNKLYLYIDAVGIKLLKGHRNNLENCEIYNQAQHTQYSKLAKRFGLRYEYRPGDSILNEYPKNIFNLKKEYKKIRRTLVDEGWRKEDAKEFIHLIKKTPMENIEQVILSRTGR